MNQRGLRSISLLTRQLMENGFDVEELTLLGKEYYTVSLNGKSVTISGNNPLYPFCTSAGRTIYRSKALSEEAARQGGLQTLDTLSVYPLEVLDWGFFKEGNAYVVKPNKGFAGIDVSVGLMSKRAISTAVENLHQKGSMALIQTQFLSDEYRFTTVDGRVISVLERQHPTVRGDGIKTIKELISEENIKRAQIDSLVPYPMIAYDAVGIDLFYIPKNGERCVLYQASMISGGASVREVMTKTHKGYIEKVETFVRIFGAGLLAVDLLIKDIKQAPDEGGYVFLEMNVSPSLALYYSERNGEHVEIIEKYIIPAFKKLLKG